MKQSHLASAAMGAALVLSVSLDAVAYCAVGGTIATERPATVRLQVHPDLAANMRHADGTVWTQGELNQSVQRTILRINESANSDIPVLVYDWATPGYACAWRDDVCAAAPHLPNHDSCGIDKTIHVVPSDCHVTSWAASGNRHLIFIQKSTGTGVRDMRWEHFSGSSDAALFEATLMHQIGHALGLAHSSACPGFETMCPAGAQPCTLMDGITDAGQAYDYWFQDDVNGLRGIYGTRNVATVRQFESSDLTEFAHLDSTVGNLTGYLAASSVPFPGVQLTLAGRRDTVTWRIPSVLDWNWSTMTFTPLLGPGTGSSIGPVGVAQDATDRYVVVTAHHPTADARKWFNRIELNKGSLAGGDWTTRLNTSPAEGSIADTRVSGVSATADRRSGSVLLAYRATDGRVLLQSVRDDTFSAVKNTGIFSRTTPVIACTSSTCLLVVVEPGRPITPTRGGRLQWATFTWSHTLATWTPGPLQTESWLIPSEPSLTAVRSAEDASGAEFTLAYRTGPSVIVTPPGSTPVPPPVQTVMLRKRSGSGFESIGVITSTSGRTNGTALGSVSFSTELFSAIQVSSH